MVELYHPPSYIPTPIPISTADRALMDVYKAKFGINHVPRGVSGLDDEQTASRRRTGHRFPQSKEFRHKQSQRRQLIRQLVTAGKTRREIAAETGMKLEAVYGALSRLQIKIPASFDEPRDG